MAAANSSASSVAIVGAGLAGLTAANLLHKFGFSVAVFEAADRLGGRTFSVWDGRTQLAMGAMWLHGGLANPLYPLVSRLGLMEPGQGEDNLPDLCDQSDSYRYDWSNCATVTDCGQSIPNSLARHAEVAVRQSLADAYELAPEQVNGCYGDRMGAYVESQFPANVRAAALAGFEPSTYEAALRAFSLFYANVEGVHSLHDLSISGGAEYSSPAGQCLVRGGFGRLVDALAARLPAGCIRLRAPVERISVSPTDGSAQLLVGSEQLTFDHAVVTVSLGVLQSGKLLQPDILPPDWLDALHQMRLGVVDKLFVKLALPVQMPDNCSHLWIVRRKLCHSWLDGVTALSVVNQARDTLLLWVAGGYAADMESRTMEQLEADLVPYLESVLRYRLPRLSKVWRTSFGSNPLFRGAYSSYKPGCRADAADKLSQPIEARTPDGSRKPTICFAGEHTSQRHYATVQGAYLSAIREATRLAEHHGLGRDSSVAML